MPAPANSKAGGPQGRMGHPAILPDPRSMDELIEKLTQAKRPVFIVGHGARFHMDAIQSLAEKWNVPILTTFKGKGLIADQHPLACGVLGRSGTPIASYFMNESDLLFVWGASFSNHTGITPKKPIVQIDFDPMALGKFHPVDVPVWGEIGRVCADLSQRNLQLSFVDQRPEIAERWSIWRNEKQRRAQDHRGNGLNSSVLFQTLSDLAQEDAVIAVDVGNNAYSFGRYFECKRQSILMSGYLGSIGFGFPAAMGAWAAERNRKIIAVTGDGGFAQYMMELLTAVKYQMNITHILLNNGELGKISKEQRADQLPVWKTQLHNPNFAEYAKNCGAWGERVSNPEHLSKAMQAALDVKGPALLEVMCDAQLI